MLASLLYSNNAAKRVATMAAFCCKTKDVSQRYARPTHQDYDAASSWRTASLAARGREKRSVEDAV